MFYKLPHMHLIALQQRAGKTFSFSHIPEKYEINFPVTDCLGGGTVHMYSKPIKPITATEIFGAYK